jgi:hypothetical protein
VTTHPGCLVNSPNPRPYQYFVPSSTRPYFLRLSFTSPFRFVFLVVLLFFRFFIAIALQTLRHFNTYIDCIAFKAIILDLGPVNFTSFATMFAARVALVALSAVGFVSAQSDSNSTFKIDPSTVDPLDKCT